MGKLKRVLKIVEFLGRIFWVFSAIALCLLFVLVFADVSGRFLFNSPIGGATEVSTFILVVIAFMALGYTQFKKEHIFVEILTVHYPRKLRIGLNIFGLLLSAAFFVIMTLRTGQRAYSDWSQNILLTHTILVLPIFWISFIASVGCALLAIALVMQVIQTGIELKENK